jgi:hypothetical protein
MAVGNGDSEQGVWALFGFEVADDDRETVLLVENQAGDLEELVGHFALLHRATENLELHVIGEEGAGDDGTEDRFVFNAGRSAVIATTIIAARSARTITTGAAGSGATKTISEAAVGDRVLTVNAKGEQVYSDVVVVPHGKNTVQATFAVVTTASGRDLKMTTNHMLPAGACAAGSLPVVAASAVSVGECVETVSGRERVVSVSTVEGRGIYTVVAMEELLVVNGVVATPYGGVNPALANVYYNLHRLAYSVAGKALLAVQGATEGVWAALALLATSR